MIPPSSNLPFISSTEIRPSVRNVVHEQGDGRATSQFKPSESQCLGHYVVMRREKPSGMKRPVQDPSMQGPIICNPAKASAARIVKIQPRGDFKIPDGRERSATEIVRFSDRQVRSLCERIPDRIIELSKSMPDRLDEIFSRISIDRHEREAIYEQYMAGYLNDRVDKTRLRILCAYLQSFGFPAPFQYISESDRAFVRDRMTLSAYTSVGVGTLRNAAIVQYDNFLHKVADINRSAQIGEDDYRIWNQLREDLGRELQPEKIIRAAQEGWFNVLISLLSMRDAGDISDLCSEHRLIAIKEAIHGGHESIAMHLLMHFENSGRNLYPEKLTQLLQDLLDIPDLHPDLPWKLIELGADLHAQGNKLKNTALHLAGRDEHVKLAEFLLNEKQARPDVLNADGDKPQDLVPRPGPRKRSPPLHFT